MAERPLLRIIKQSGLYAIGNVAVKLSGLLLAPFYLDSRYLSLSDYGYLALLMATSQIGIFVVGLGIGTGLLKFMADREMAGVRDRLPFTALVTTIGVSVLAWFAFQAGATGLSRLILGSPDRSLILMALGTYVVFKTVGAVPMMLLRIQERAGLFALAMALEMGLLLGGVYYFLVVRQEGLYGVMEAYMWSAGASTAVLLVGSLQRIRWRFDGSLLKPLIRYGSPLVMVSLASLVLNAGDRYLLNGLTDAETVGMYDWAARISGVLNLLVVQSFQLAFTVIGLKTLGDGDHGLHRRTFRHYTVWAGWAVLALSLLAYDGTLVLTRIGADPHYLDASGLVLPLAFGFYVYGNYVIITNVLYAAWKTPVIGVLVVGAALLNIVLNLLLIPVAGSMGAAVATVCSYAALAGGAYRRAEREMRMGYPWRTFGLTVGLILALYAAGALTADWSTGMRLTARIGLILSYLPLGAWLGLYSREELRAGWEALRARRSGRPAAGSEGT
ncbi:MAG: oligosaccharide flippase family protein [Rhodothermales bacterium]